MPLNASAAFGTRMAANIIKMNARPKKRLGQNFLIDPNIQKKITAACGFKKTDIILEIGSGAGQMTKPISEQAGFVYALEIDHDLCGILKRNLHNLDNVTIINQDILKLDFNAYFANIKNRIKIFGNIPYYISSPIIEHIIKYRDKIEVIFITVQKEFAGRMAASAGTKQYGSLSCFVQYYLEPKIMFSISRNCFCPAPNVDSSFLKMAVREKAAVAVKDEKLFFAIIRAGFNKRRKTLRNSLSEILNKRELEYFFEEYGINKNIRPENLSLPDFANLANYAYTLHS